LGFFFIAVWRIVSSDRKPLCYHLTNLYSEYRIKNQENIYQYIFKNHIYNYFTNSSKCVNKRQVIFKILDAQGSFYCKNSSDICKSEALHKWAVFGWEWWPFPVLVPQRSPNYNETARLLIPRWAFGGRRGKSRATDLCIPMGHVSYKAAAFFAL